MSYRDRSIGEFLDEIASERVTPAGGTALAVAGATGAALVEMACIHADGTADDSTVDLTEERAALAERRSQLLELGAQDAIVVDELFGSNDPAPDDPMLRRAVTVPLGIGQACLQVMEHAQRVFAAVTTDVAADARAGLSLARAVVEATAYMVHTNLAISEDASFVRDIERQVAELERAADALAPG